MRYLTTTFRISISLVCLVVSVLFAARLIGLVPDGTGALVKARRSLCEMIAIDCSLAAERSDLQLIEQSLTAIVERNAELRSAEVISSTQRVLVRVPNDDSVDANSNDQGQNTEVITVPISASGVPWGTVELTFDPLVDNVGWFIVRDPFIRLVLFVSAATCLMYSFYLRRILQHLDPSKVVPDRVRMTLDTLAEGLFVIDKEERIVLANRAFADTLGSTAAELQGRAAAVLPWCNLGDDEPEKKEFPWTRSIREGTTQTGDVLHVRVKGSRPRTFKVSVAPIFDEKGNCEGALTSFDDVTALEERNAQLTEMLDKLKESRDKIRQQNQELEVLATRDPLTSALNRRSFFEYFEKQWRASQRYGHPLSCVMVDIDHFKSINDNHGHSVGDQVLQRVSAVLQKVRDCDIVCRYGGEEFCVLLPHAAIDDAAAAAERYRCALEETSFGEVSITASLGVSSLELGAETPQQLLDEADKCLYVAKRRGRNCVVRWDDAAEDEKIESSEVSCADSAEETDANESIPFQVVTALISALAYRDADTAEHSRRVADLCVAVAHRLMTLSEAYLLENAALLHDIGKIGVPDSILLKPGPLTQEEWKVMSTHDRIGVEIIRSTFACNELTKTVQSHHATFAGDPRHPELPSGKDLPLGARILTIADAYDAMVSDRVYRKGRSKEEAFAELRRCAGRQFDPELVERFVEVATARDESRTENCSTVSKKTALRIGVQIERIAQALDNQDIPGLEALVGRLKATATVSGVPTIANAAAQLEECLSGEEDWVNILSVTVELLELCRATQRSYISRDVESENDCDSDMVAEVNV